MEQSVGRVFVLCLGLFFCGFLSAASIELKVLDMQENELEVVGIGKPFIVKVSMDGFKKELVSHQFLT